jgi:PTS system nitrogen regulatory IIA component
MDIKEFLAPTDVLADFAVAGKVALLQGLAQRASDSVKLPPELISNALLKREELGSTGTGGGIAIPHARMPGLDKAFGMLIRLKQPVDFDAIDDRPVDLIFLLLLPIASNKEQLNALASVARILRNPESVRSLRRARDPADLFRAMVTLA